MSALCTLDAAAIEAIAFEIHREIDDRRRVFPGRVAKGDMLASEAEQQLALAGAWCEDLRRVHACWFAKPWTPPTEAQHGITWRRRRSALIHELAQRRRLYPDQIAKGSLTTEQAQHRITCLEQLLEIYEDGWDWLASDGRRTGDTANAEFAAMRATRDQRLALLARKPAGAGSGQP